MKSIFRYPGTTQNAIRDEILASSPRGYLEYREPFIGGGSVFFQQAQLHSFRNTWINDIDPGLISVYLALQNDSDEFIALCRKIRLATDLEYPHETRSERYILSRRMGKSYNNQLKALQRTNGSTEWDTENAARYYFIHRVGYGGRVRLRSNAKTFYHHPKGWDITTTDRLKWAGRLMQKVKITNVDFEDVLREPSVCPADKVWCFIDPPWMCDTEADPVQRLYDQSFSEVDHVRLSRLLHVLPYKFTLLYDDHEKIRSLYRPLNFNVQKNPATFRGSRGGKTTDILIIRNH